MFTQERGLKNLADYKNHEGYSDPTAHQALSEETEEMGNLGRLIRHIKYICGLAGYEVEGRITLRNKNTGRIWK